MWWKAEIPPGVDLGKRSTSPLESWWWGSGSTSNENMGTKPLCLIPVWCSRIVHYRCNAQVPGGHCGGVVRSQYPRFRSLLKEKLYCIPPRCKRKGQILVACNGSSCQEKKRENTARFDIRSTVLCLLSPGSRTPLL